MASDSFQFPPAVEDYLSEHNVLNLSTCGEDGPWAAAVFYAHTGLQFFFMSNPDTRHGRHIVATGRMAAAVHEDYSSWREIKGVQMTGSVRVVDDPAGRKEGLKAFFRKFCFAEAFLRGDVPEALRERMRNIHLFCFEPDLVLWLDNSTGFGNRVQVYPEP